MGRRLSPNAVRGAVARLQGEYFENMLRHACARERIQCTKIPDGCRMIRTKSGAVIPKRVPTPFDFILAKDGVTACIDCKSIDSGNLSYSCMTPHQVLNLIGFFDNRIPAGYVVYFRDQNAIVFFDAKKLYHLKRKESLKLEDGVILGSAEQFTLRPVIDLFKTGG